MTESNPASNLKELVKDEAELRATVLDLGDASIRHISRDDLSLLIVTGVFTRALVKEIERICSQCRTSIGLDFSEIKTNPTTKKRFDGAVVALLGTVRERLHSRGLELSLCSPPSELVDLLKLSGAINGYHVSSDASAAGLPLSSRGPAIGQPPGEQPNALGQRPATVHRRILHINQSLKRAVNLEKGLDSAAKCVQRFLPSSPPQLPGYSFTFYYQSSEKVGGDFFDFIPLPDDRLGLVVGDVSGHGIDAALLMGITKKVIQLRACDAAATSPKRVLMQANADVVGDFHKYSFVTSIYGILDAKNHTFTFARAGHEHPILFGPAVAPQSVSSRGIALGVDSGRLFESVLEEVTINIGSRGHVLLLTDGVAECWNTRGASYTRERLLYTLSQLDTSRSCNEVLESLLASIKEFQGGREQEDDMTTILIQRHQ